MYVHVGNPAKQLTYLIDQPDLELRSTSGYKIISIERRIEIGEIRRKSIGNWGNADPGETDIVGE